MVFSPPVNPAAAPRMLPQVFPAPTRPSWRISPREGGSYCERLVDNLPFPNIAIRRTSKLSTAIPFHPCYDFRQQISGIGNAATSGTRSAGCLRTALKHSLMLGLFGGLRVRHFWILGAWTIASRFRGGVVRPRIPQNFRTRREKMATGTACGCDVVPTACRGADVSFGRRDATHRSRSPRSTRRPRVLRRRADVMHRVRDDLHRAVRFRDILG